MDQIGIQIKERERERKGEKVRGRLLGVCLEEEGFVEEDEDEKEECWEKGWWLIRINDKDINDDDDDDVEEGKESKWGDKGMLCTSLVHQKLIRSC